MNAEPQIKTIHFECPVCQQRIEAPAIQSREENICPTCGHTFRPYQAMVDAAQKKLASHPALAIIAEDSKPDHSSEASMWIKIIGGILVAVSALAYIITITEAIGGEAVQNTNWALPALITGLIFIIISILMEIRDALARKK